MNKHRTTALIVVIIFGLVALGGILAVTLSADNGQNRVRFSCRGTTGVYESVWNDGLAVVPNDPACVK